MLQLKNVTLRRGSLPLLESADLLVHAGEKIGFIGNNGTGKSSLFALLRGDLEPEAGEMELIKHIRLAEIRQDIPAGQELILNYVLGGDHQLAALQQKITAAESQYDGAALANLYQQFSDSDGYTAESRAAKLLVGLGFLQSDLTRAIDDFSGGWRMRLNLARVLMTPADLMLLDEPTNHLDLEAIVWLEQWLQNLPQTILIISHDREFLDHVVKRIVHLENRTLKSYTGNYSDFEDQYAQALMQQAALYAAQQRQLQHLTSFVERFRAKASKARQAQSRLKMIERMDKVAAVQAQRAFHFEFYPAPAVGDPLLSFQHIDIGYSDNMILRDVSFSIYQGARIALIGPNGAGKSTFVKAIAGLLEITGNISQNNKLKIGYFTQHQLEDLRPNEHALWHLKQMAPQMPEKEARVFLGGFNFRDDRVFEAVNHFSGGEKARLALALLVLQKPNLLLLDEPSNHLDLEMREALAEALQAYEGAMVLITHDRYLINSLADELFLVANGKVTPFTDDLRKYEQWLLTNNIADEPKPIKKERIKPAVKSGNIEKKIEKVERELTEKQTLLEKIEADLVEYYSRTKQEPNYVNALLEKREQLRVDIEELELRLLNYWEQ